MKQTTLIAIVAIFSITLFTLTVAVRNFVSTPISPSPVSKLAALQSNADNQIFDEIVNDLPYSETVESCFGGGIFVFDYPDINYLFQKKVEDISEDAVINFLKKLSDSSDEQVIRRAVYLSGLVAEGKKENMSIVMELKRILAEHPTNDRINIEIRRSLRKIKGDSYRLSSNR